MARRAGTGVMFALSILMLVLSASPPAALAPDNAKAGDSLYRAGRYEEAAAAYARARQARPTDDALLLKQFLACESGPRGCAQDARVDIYYAEKNHSPYTGLMMGYMRSRITIMRGSRMPSPLSGSDWRAFHGDSPLSEREFYALAGEGKLAERANRRRKLAWGMGASGAALALASVVFWASPPGDCETRSGAAGCRAARAGSVLLGAGGLGTAFAGLALGRWALIPMDSARALAHRYNLADLRARMDAFELFGGGRHRAAAQGEMGGH